MFLGLTLWTNLFSIYFTPSSMNLNIFFYLNHYKSTWVKCLHSVFWTTSSPINTNSHWQTAKKEKKIKLLITPKRNNMYIPECVWQLIQRDYRLQRYLVWIRWEIYSFTRWQKKESTGIVLGCECVCVSVSVSVKGVYRNKGRTTVSVGKSEITKTGTLRSFMGDWVNQACILYNISTNK